RSLELWQENSEPLELALALESIGYSQFMAGEYADALRSMEDCLEQYRKFGSAKLVTRGRVNVGQMLVALGDVERTEPLARETLAKVGLKTNPNPFITHCIIWATAPCGVASRRRPSAFTARACARRLITEIKWRPPLKCKGWRWV